MLDPQSKIVNDVIDISSVTIDNGDLKIIPNTTIENVLSLIIASGYFFCRWFRNNGIIFNKGLITKILKRPKGINIFIKSGLKLSMRDIGISVACDGVCLTLISIKNKIMEFYLSDETINRSKFNYIRLKDEFNLELPN